MQLIQLLSDLGYGAAIGGANGVHWHRRVNFGSSDAFYLVG